MKNEQNWVLPTIWFRRENQAGVFQPDKFASRLAPDI